MKGRFTRVEIMQLLECGIPECLCDGEVLYAVQRILGFMEDIVKHNHKKLQLIRAVGEIKRELSEEIMKIIGAIRNILGIRGYD